MRLHPPKDAVQNLNSGAHMGTLVEHDAFGAVAHDRIGYLGPRWQALVAQGFEHLGHPDYREMGSLADSQDLFLHLGQSLETAFH